MCRIADVVARGRRLAYQNPWNEEPFVEQQNEPAVKSFVDFWNTDVTGDLAADFDTAVDAARWGDPVEGGTLANKTDCIRLYRDVIAPDQAHAVAAALVDNRDVRISNPFGPAGAIATTDDAGGPAWIFFGFAPVQAFPLCRDAAEAAARRVPEAGGRGEC